MATDTNKKSTDQTLQNQQKQDHIEEHGTHNAESQEVIHKDLHEVATPSTHQAENHSPLAQFEVKELLHVKLFGFDISITNSSLYMIIATFLALIFLAFISRRRNIVPTKIQLIAESFYQMIAEMARSNIGSQSTKFIPLILTLFTFIFACNFIGMTPYSFTPTSQIATTFTLSIGTFAIVLLYGIIHNGPIKFFKHFIPSGAPWWIVPIIFAIELLSFFIRPFTLALRLLANMVAGHILMKIIAGFIIALGVGFGFLPFAFALAITGFELLVAFLQAYIFSILVCIYLGEASADH